MRDVLKESDVFVSVITFCKYDLLTQEAQEILVPTAAERDVAVITASPLHAGLLGSKRELWMENGRFADLYDKLDQVEALLADLPKTLLILPCAISYRIRKCLSCYRGWRPSRNWKRRFRWLTDIIYRRNSSHKLKRLNEYPVKFKRIKR